MSETANYKLHITDDETELFKVWREKMNGTENSNMIKIDAALTEKANNSVVVNSTLFANAWVGIASPYKQDIQIEGLTSERNGTIDISNSATAEQRELARNAMLFVCGQSSGVLTIAADGDCPTADIPVSIILLD